VIKAANRAGAARSNQAVSGWVRVSRAGILYSFIAFLLLTLITQWRAQTCGKRAAPSDKIKKTPHHHEISETHRSAHLHNTADDPYLPLSSFRKGKVGNN
jgi:hypothetical protein